MMKQLGGIDAAFLYMETPETPMHVAAMSLYQPPADMQGSFHEHFTAFFKTRMHLIPIFSKRLARTVLELDHPGWVDAEPDLAHHIRAVTLPAPGGRAELEALVGELHSAALDRDRPLWQFTVIDGLADGTVGLYAKMHHAAVDGGAGMIIVQALFDFTPVPRSVPAPVPAPKPKRKPTIPERALLGVNDLLANVVRQQLDAMQAVPQMLTTLTNLVSPPPAPKKKAPAAAEAAEAPKKKRSGLDLLPKLPRLPELPRLAPKTPFNVTITPKRTYAMRTLSLMDAKAIKKATDTKINDVVMAVCAGAIRRYLLEKKALPDQPLVAFVPISLREMGNTDINNQVFGMNCLLATDVADPLERLATIHRTTNDAKMMAGSVKDIAPKDFTLLGAPLLLPGLMSLYGKSGLADLVPMAVNLVISNTPGPPFPLFCAGAKVLALFPVSIPVHGIGLNITVQSYMENLDFGITADAKALPDAGRLGDLLVEAMAELKAAALAKPKVAAG